MQTISIPEFGFGDARKKKFSYEFYVRHDACEDDTRPPSTPSQETVTAAVNIMLLLRKPLFGASVVQAYWDCLRGTKKFDYW
jgi:Glu-tRNA(Gln) amidotransferase subunit E-like FAD-binding protein